MTSDAKSDAGGAPHSVEDIENPTEAELRDTLRSSDLPVGEDIEGRLGRDPGAAKAVAMEREAAPDTSEEE